MSTDQIPLFPFHYGEEAEQYSFYRIPKILFAEPVFEGLSTDAKLLYGLLLDRMQLSIRNQWVDEDGKVYIYFTIGTIMEALNCGNKKAGQLLAELDDQRGIGLITRVRQGLGKPDKIFVHKCTLPEMSFQHIRKCEKDSSGDAVSTGQERSKVHGNNTEKNKTEKRDNDSILSGEGNRTETDWYSCYRSYFLQQLDFEILLSEYPFEKEQLYEILELLTEVCSSTRKTIRISGEERPSNIVKSRMMKLTAEHIRFVLMCLKENTTKVKNIRQYMLATLYNAPTTISSYYSALVNHDMYGSGG